MILEDLPIIKDIRIKRLNSEDIESFYDACIFSGQNLKGPSPYSALLKTGKAVTVSYTHLTLPTKRIV